MKTRILVLVATATLLGLAAGACADVTTDALVVDDRTFGRGEVMDYLNDIADEVADNPEISATVAASNGGFPADITAALLTLFIQNEVFAQRLQATGQDVTEDEISAVAAEMGGDGLERFDRLRATLEARARALSTLGVDPAAAMIEADVSIDPRWGAWDAQAGGVVPPFALR